MRYFIGSSVYVTLLLFLSLSSSFWILPVMTLDLVLIGGGHAHVHILKMLGMSPYREILKKSDIHVTLVTNTLFTPYSGMLPGYVAGHYSYEDVHLDLQRICRFSGIRLIHQACTEIIYDSSSTTTTTQDENNGSTGLRRGGWIRCASSSKEGSNDDDPLTIRFDVTSIDVGSTPGAADWSILNHPRVIPVKPIATFCRFYEGLQQRFLMEMSDESSSSSSGVHRIAVVGGGAGGVELTLSIQKNLQDLLYRQNSRKKKKKKKIQLEMVLVTRGSKVLESSNPLAQKAISRILQERNIQIHLNSPVEKIIDRDGSSFLHVEGSSSSSGGDRPAMDIPFDDCFWCTNAAGATWLSEKTPFPCDEQGFVKVDATYQVVDHPGVFAAGDCCHRIEHPRPKAGVFAVRAGPPLLDNLMASLLQQPLKPHIPQTIFLSIISAGNRYAVATRGTDFCREGRWVWKWKDRIDR